MEKLNHLDTPACTDFARGLLELRPCNPTRGVMVAGPGRCGTTGVARVIDALGIPFYGEPDPVTAEEAEVAKAFGCYPPEPEDSNTLREIFGGIRVMAKCPLSMLRAESNPDLGNKAQVDWILVTRDITPQCHYDREGQPGKPIHTVLRERAKATLNFRCRGLNYR